MVNSLAKQLTFRIMVVVLAMIAVIAGIVYFHVREYMSDEAEERYEGVLQRDHEEFRRRLSDVMVAAKNNLHEVECNIDDPQKAAEHMERILRLNPTVITCGIVYQPGYFPDRKRCLEIIATHDSLGSIHVRTIENDHNAYLDRKWYVDGMTKDTAQWSEVYFEQDLIPGVTSRRQLTSYVTPVHDKQGKTVALFGTDLKLEFLRYEIMNDLQEKIEKFEKAQLHHRRCGRRVGILECAHLAAPHSGGHRHDARRIPSHDYQRPVSLMPQRLILSTGAILLQGSGRSTTSPSDV